MTDIRIGIIMNGVTGRMGTNQHLVRSINAIRAQGGVTWARAAHHARARPAYQPMANTTAATAAAANPCFI